MKKPRIYMSPFNTVYPMYVQKVERKGREAEEVDQVITWLFGYENLHQLLQTDINVEQFVIEAPNFNPNAALVKGVICGVRVEEVEDPVMYRIRVLDKMIDEIAKGKAMEKILRK